MVNFFDFFRQNYLRAYRLLLNIPHQHNVTLCYFIYISPSLPSFWRKSRLPLPLKSFTNFFFFLFLPLPPSSPTHIPDWLRTRSNYHPKNTNTISATFSSQKNPKNPKTNKPKNKTTQNPLKQIPIPFPHGFPPFSPLRLRLGHHSINLLYYHDPKIHNPLHKQALNLLIYLPPPHRCTISHNYAPIDPMGSDQIGDNRWREAQTLCHPPVNRSNVCYLYRIRFYRGIKLFCFSLGE